MIYEVVEIREGKPDTKLRTFITREELAIAVANKRMEYLKKKGIFDREIVVRRLLA